MSTVEWQNIACFKKSLVGCGNLAIQYVVLAISRKTRKIHKYITRTKLNSTLDSIGFSLKQLNIDDYSVIFRNLPKQYNPIQW